MARGSDGFLGRTASSAAQHAASTLVSLLERAGRHDEAKSYERRAGLRLRGDEMEKALKKMIG